MDSFQDNACQQADNPQHQGKYLKIHPSNLSSEIEDLIFAKKNLEAELAAMREELHYLAAEKRVLDHSPPEGSNAFLRVLLQKHSALLHELHYSQHGYKEKHTVNHKGILGNSFEIIKRKSASRSGFVSCTPFSGNPCIAISGHGRGGTTALASALSKLSHYKLYRSQSANYEDDLLWEMLVSNPIPIRQIAHLILDRDRESLRWLIKIPHLTYFVMNNPELAESFAGRNFIVVTRDMTSCAISEIAAGAYEGAENYCQHYERILSSKNWIISNAQEFGWGTALVSYEKLIKYPRETLSDLYTWILGVNPSDEEITAMTDQIGEANIEGYLNMFSYRSPGANEGSKIFQDT